MEIKRKILGILLVMVMVLSYMPAPVYAETVSGTCGTCNWVFDYDGVLTISAGELGDWGHLNSPPWRNYASLVKTVVFEGDVVVQRGDYFFSGMSNLESIDLGGLDFSEVTSENGIFWGCEKLSNIDLSGFDTSRVSEMNEMFRDCKSLKELDLSSFDTSSAIEMMFMFAGCENLSKVNLTSFDTSKVYTMHYAFEGCERLEELDLTSFNHPKGCSTEGMFDGCSSLKKLVLGDAYFSNAKFPVTMRDTTTGIVYNEGNYIPIKNCTFIAKNAIDSHTFDIPEDTNCFGNEAGAFYYGEYKTEDQLTATEKKNIKSYLKKHRARDMSDKYSKGYFILTDEFKEKEPFNYTYGLSSIWYNKLVSGLGKRDKAIIKDKINGDFNGACRGIAATMALASQGIDLYEMGITQNYYYSDIPKDNHKLRYAIFYYQLKQFRPENPYTKSTYSFYYNTFMVPFLGGVSLHDFLEALVDEGLYCKETEKPFIFSYSHNGEKGHSILAYNIIENDDDSYDLLLYNMNNFEARKCHIDLKEDTIHFVDSNNYILDESNYIYLGFVGIDDLYGSALSRNTKSTSSSDNGSRLIVSADNKFTVTNERGEFISYDGEKLSGDMRIYDLNYIETSAEDEKQTISFKVEPYESLTMSDFDTETELNGEINGEYYTATVDGADSFVFSENQISIQGEDYTFTGGTTAGNDSDNLYKVSADAQGDVTLTANDDTLLVTSEDELSDAVVAEYGDSSVDYTEVEAENGSIEVSTNKTDINECYVDLATTKYTYNGKEKTPKVSVQHGDKVLRLGDDYIVKYQNNIKAGKAYIILTGTGDYTGTIKQSFTINKASNPLSIKAKTASVKYSKLKKKNQTLAVSKVIKFTKQLKDKKTYTLSSAVKGKKSFKKYFTINKTTGKVTVKKGLKKGTYKVKVKVKAAGNTNYKASAVKTVTFTIKVK